MQQKAKCKKCITTPVSNWVRVVVLTLYVQTIEPLPPPRPSLPAQCMPPDILSMALALYRLLGWGNTAMQGTGVLMGYTQ